MHIIQVRLKGQSPLLCNRFPDESRKVPPSSSLKSQCQKKLHLDGKGRPFIPAKKLVGCFSNTIYFIKKHEPQHPIITVRDFYLHVFLVEKEILIESTESWEVDSRNSEVELPKRLIHRPMFKSWELNFTLQTEGISTDRVRDLVQLSGHKMGLGDCRPSHRGTLGKFTVEKWEMASET